jgi:tRNA pseudouridine55 synthase
MDGLLIIDKPSGITSRDAVNRLQRLLPPRTKIGHTGTLDPLATGVLVVCVGQATRLAEYVQAMDKVYETTIVLGARSDTDDADGTVTPTPEATTIDEATVRAILPQFIGAIEQTPPAYSAVKVGGRRAYDLARRGREVEIAPRTVTIYDIGVRGYEWPELRLEIRCGKGTYIRSLARDLGEALGCGAYVKELRRTRVGPFTTAESVSVDKAAIEVQSRMLPVRAAVAHLPTMELDAETIQKWRQGHAVVAPPELSDSLRTDVAIFDTSQSFVGVGYIAGDSMIRPVKVFAAS